MLGQAAPNTESGSPKLIKATYMITNKIEYTILPPYMAKATCYQCTPNRYMVVKIKPIQINNNPKDRLLEMTILFSMSCK